MRKKVGDVAIDEGGRVDFKGLLYRTCKKKLETKFVINKSEGNKNIQTKLLK